jgi:hypothetical protein
MSTQRLPIPGEDNGDWGAILNGFLEVAHNGDGTLLSSAVIAAGAITETTANGLYAPVGNYVLPSVSNNWTALQAFTEVTVSDKTSTSNVALRLQATENHYYVSKSSNASDSNDGLSAGSAFATIAEALSTLGSNSGIIELGAGTWTISSSIVLTSNLTIIGHGEAQTTLQAQPGITTDVVTGTNVSNVTIQDLTIDSNSTAPHGIYFLASSGSGCLNNRLRNVTLKNGTTYGLKVSGQAAGGYSSEIDCINVTATANVSDGAFFAYSSRVNVQGGRYNSNGNSPSQTGNGMAIAGCQNVIVEGVEASNNGGHGITTATPGSGSPMENLTIKGCQCNNNGIVGNTRGGGIVMSVQALQFCIEGNVCIGALTYGIDIDVAVVGGAGAMQPSVGAVVGNVAAGTRDGPGIHINCSAFGACSGNVCYDNVGTLGYGISVNSAFGWSFGPNVLVNNALWGMIIEPALGTETLNGVATSPGSHVIAVQTYYGNGSGTLSVDASNTNMTVLNNGVGATGPTGPAGPGLAAPLVSGQYSASGLGTTSSYAAAANTLYAVPFIPATSDSVDRLGIGISVAGGSGSVVRMGIYADNGDYKPGSLLGDYGTASATTVAYAETATNGSPVALTTGTLYWLAFASQGSPATNPSVRAITGVSPLIVTPNSDYTGCMGYDQGSISGSLPSSWGSTYNVAPTVPWVKPRGV